MPKPCPECRSHNTRQMDKDTFGDYAYCLSCYHKFKSYARPIVKPAMVKSSRTIEMARARARIENLRKRIERIEKEIEAL